MAVPAKYSPEKCTGSFLLFCKLFLNRNWFENQDLQNQKVSHHLAARHILNFVHFAFRFSFSVLFIFRFSHLLFSIIFIVRVVRYHAFRLIARRMCSVFRSHTFVLVVGGVALRQCLRVHASSANSLSDTHLKWRAGVSELFFPWIMRCAFVLDFFSVPPLANFCGFLNFHVCLEFKMMVSCSESEFNQPWNLCGCIVSGIL